MFAVNGGGSANGYLTLRFRRINWVPRQVQDRNILAAELQPAPVLGPFSVSIRAPKLLAGTITSSGTIEFTERVILDTDVRYLGAADELAGLKLTQGGRLWNIIGNTTGWKFHIFVERRAGAEPIPVQGAPFAVVEADGITPHLLDPGNPHWRDYRDLANWERRLHVEPRTPEPVGLTTAITLNDDGTTTVTTNQNLTDESGHYIGGELEIGNATWQVIAHTTGDNFRLTVVNRRRHRGTGLVDNAAPPENASFVYWPDIAIPIAPLAGDQGAIGVTAADNKRYRPDRWPGAEPAHAGNESHVSAPAIIIVVDRTAPPAVAANQDVLTATAADYYGKSHFIIRWRNAGAGFRYKVYRALEQTRDMAPPAADYILLNAEPIRAEDHPDIAEPGHAIVDSEILAYRDVLDGKSTSRYYYRVRAVSATGVLGEWSEVIGPVVCPDVVPPRSPLITKVLGGDRQITLKWASNRESDLFEYRLYRADSATAAEDLRSMTLVHNGPEVEWTDKPVAPGTKLYYVLTAVDTSGNVSHPGPTVVGRAYTGT